MKNGLVWNKELTIKRYTPQRCFLVIKEDNEQFMINKPASRIIAAFDGTKTYSDVVESLSDEYKEDIKTIKEKVDDYLSVLANKCNLYLVENNTKLKRDVSFIGEESLYPKVVSIEITQNCNLSCLHCYGEFGSSGKTEIMSLDNVKKLLLQLSDAGVEIIEITGGEATTHPNLLEILEYANSLKFKKIDLLTNGVCISERIKKYIISNNKKMFVQIDIQSMKDSYLKWFTQRDISAKRILNNILELKKGDVKIRVATTVTKKNLKEIYEIARFVWENEMIWGVSGVEPLGTAEKTKEKSSLYLNEEDIKYMQRVLEKIARDFPGIMQLVDDNEKSNDYNCGVLSGHAVINSKGFIKLCTMDNLEYFNSSIGNVFEKDIKEIYDENYEIIGAISTQDVLLFTSDECQGCEYLASCTGCLLRMFLNIRKKNFECSWYKQVVNKKISNKFFTKLS